jgi:flavin-dependent dehydrogenase
MALGRHGVRVTLYERSRGPCLKACGEGLLPHGVAALRDIAGLPEAPRVRGLRFVAGDISVEADFPEGFGLVVRRDRFDAWLRGKAAATPNVDLRIGTPYRAGGERFVVGADGKRSMFHRRLHARPSTPRRVGLSTHVGGLQGLGNRVEVFFHADGEVYVAPTGGGEALVSALFYQSAFRRDGITHLLSSIPELRARTSRIEQTTPLLACAPLGLRVSRLVDEGLLLIGDAAGAPDPITGDGIAMAIVSAQPAAMAILSGDLYAYERTRLGMGRTADRLGKLLLGIPRADGRTARMLLQRRALVPTLLDVAVGRRPLTAATMIRAVCSR